MKLMQQCASQVSFVARRRFVSLRHLRQLSPTVHLPPSRIKARSVPSQPMDKTGQHPECDLEMDTPLKQCC